MTLRLFVTLVFVGGALSAAGCGSSPEIGSGGTGSPGSGSSSKEPEAVIMCGDATVQSNESCDDGNTIETDACLPTCIQASCGDGIVRQGVEECDDGNANFLDACLPTCRLAVCGDGVLNAATEACDDGNRVDTDGCRNTCVVAACGDGILRDGVEACDDGNRVNTDACTNACSLASCGDGVVASGEVCDDGNSVATDACTNACLVARCGDGVVRDSIETCDDGNDVATDACTNACIEARCGDGIVRTGVEECDDTNSNPSDGCNNLCLLAYDIAAQGSTISINGALATTDRFWARPTSTCGSRSGTSHNYDTYVIANNSGAARTVTIDAAWSGFDGYLHVFRQPFAPPSLSTCVVGNDDFNGSTLVSRLSNVAIAAGESLVIVTSTYWATEVGNYTLTVTTN